MARPLLLPPPPLLLLPPGGGSGSPRSVFRTIYTAVSEPGPALPDFTVVVHMNNLPSAHYDSDTRKVRLRAPWTRKMLEEHPEYWKKYTQMVQQDEVELIGGLKTLQTIFSQSTGFHTWQMMASSEVGLERPKGQYFQFAYDGRDFFTLDIESYTWKAADPMAQTIMDKWDVNLYFANRFKTYVEETCAEWFLGLMRYGKEELQRTEPPKVTVTRKAGQDDTETLTCRAHGFYPREIDMAWTRDGEAWLQDTFRGVLAPNSDRTYHAWVGIRIDPAERERFRCRVEHDALPEPLNLAWEEPGGGKLGLIIGCTVGAVLLPALVVGIFFCFRTRRKGYRGASRTEGLV